MRNSQKQVPSSRRWRRWGCSILVVIVLIPVLNYAVYLLGRGPISRSPGFIAHRGSKLVEPENTAAAFTHAVETGANWIEFDVQRSSDGVLIVIHDDTVDRTTNGTGNVRDLTFEELRALDAGNGEQIPTFQEVIQLAENTGVGVFPEVKSPQFFPGLEQEIVQELKENDFLDRAVIQSFSPEIIESILSATPEARVCLLTHLWELDLRNKPLAAGQPICPMAEMVVLNPWMIRQVHDQNREAYVWFGVIEHPLVMRLILFLGADGLMVDDTIGMAQVLDR